MSEITDADLQWVQPVAAKRAFELRAADRTLARLHFRSSFDSLAYVESDIGCWVFQRGQGWGAPIGVAECGTRQPFALLQRSWLRAGGTVRCENGAQFSITANFTETEYRVTAEAGDMLLRLKTDGLVHLSAHVKIFPTATSYPELPWLIALSWYVWVLSNMDAARGALRRRWWLR